jgi:uncharacterized protein YjdB
MAILGGSNAVAEASSSTLPSYHFKINSKTIADGAEYELKTASTYIYAVADGWAAPSTVVWTSSEPGVVTLEATATANCQRIIRKGPGYSNITATITQDGYSYIISFMIFVDLEIDHQKTGTVIATTTENKVLVMDTIGQTKKVYVKYKDYTADDSTTETGEDISSTSLLFESDNNGVVTVTADGTVKAVGAGSAAITITSSTMSSSDKPLSISLRVVVKPQFSFTYSTGSSTVTCNSASDNKGDTGVYTGVPTSFVLNSNATVGDNLIWVVYNVVGDKRTKISEGVSSKMTYTINDSGTVSFSGIKTGTYEIYAFTYKDYTQNNTNVPYAYMKIYVPIAIDSSVIIMNVGDTYNLLENSNITNTDLFIEPTGYDSNIAKFDASTYIITAKKQGSVTITLVYDPDQELFQGITIPDITITVKVIDGISLSTSKATIYTKGKLQLEAIVTDSTAAITWSSSNTSIATVTDGLVTGVKAGTAIITASQKINGVVKKATCEITVQQSVETITVSPSTTTLAINAYLTLHATITPKNLSGITLQWKSSNESVVKIVENSALTATIQGIAGGHAVISAINQDNVVVGYCDVTVQQPVTSIVLSETAVTVNLTQKTLQLRATVYPDNAANKEVVWSTTDTSKATVDANGLVTLVKPGTVTVIATSKDNAAAVAYCTLTIQIPVVSIALDETTKTMYVGESARMSYVILPANASNNAVTWVSTNTSVITVDSAGKVTAKGVGTAVIILRTSDGGYASYCTITVKLIATTVKFDVAKLSLKTGEYYVLKTTLTPKGSTDNDLTWESSDTKVATVDAEGKVIGKSAGTCIIMARTEAGGVAYCTVTVSQAVTGLVLNFSDKTIYKGEKFTLEASVTPTSATKPGVTWKSSNTKVITVDDKGEVTGIVGGVAIITCTTADGGYAATCVVTVKETVTKITLNYETYSLGIDKTFKLVATVSTETATNQNVTWTSSNEKVATVSAAGKVIGIKPGYATITAIAQDGSEVEASCEVRVVTLVTSVTLNKTTLTMFVGESKSVKATIRPSNASYQKARWSSSDETIAIVDEDGGIIGIKSGSVMITAEAQDSSGKKAICYVTVYDRVASTGITLQDKKITMVPGESKIVEMVLIPSASTDDVTWSSDNAAVATVNRDTGKIVAKSTGTAYITVMTDSGKTATVEVTVIGLNITKLVTEEYTTYPQALSVEGATDTVTWRSSNPQIAIVKSDGTISTRGVGKVTITATVNGRKLTCTVIVNSMS